MFAAKLGSQKSRLLSQRTVAVLGLSLALGLGGAACSNDDGTCDGGTRPDACPSPDLAPSPVALGAMIASKNGCHGCHDDPAGVFAGRTTPLTGTMVYPANITPDNDTGIGSWSDADITSAVRTGIDDEGMPLCPNMPKFSTLTDEDMKNLIAYLRSVPAVNHTVPESTCPPVKP